jgi:hypothetical protein
VRLLLDESSTRAQLRLVHQQRRVVLTELDVQQQEPMPLVQKQQEQMRHHAR